MSVKLHQVSRAHARVLVGKSCFICEEQMRKHDNSVSCLTRGRIGMSAAETAITGAARTRYVTSPPSSERANSNAPKAPSPAQEVNDPGGSAVKNTGDQTGTRLCGSHDAAATPVTRLIFRSLIAL